MIMRWVLDKLELMKDEPFVLVKDSLRLLPEQEGEIHRFAKANQYTVLVASTNLVFRELLESIKKSGKKVKLLVIDRTPDRRKTSATAARAPALLYPDLLCRIKNDAIIDVKMRRFLIDYTGDPGWPVDSDDPRFARLIAGSLGAAIKAHAGLRDADPQRFTDTDFKAIVAYASLGVPEAAFKKQNTRQYWRIGLVGRQAIENLASFSSDIADSVRANLRQAPTPFCWLADSPQEPVIRAFYLAVILSQHSEQWKFILAKIDPDLQPYCDIDDAILREAAAELINIGSGKAHDDLSAAEESLSKDAMQYIFHEQMHIMENGRFAQCIENEAYSVLFRCFALIAAIDDVLSDKPTVDAHKKLTTLLYRTKKNSTQAFVESRRSPAWVNLKAAYSRAQNIISIKRNMEITLKNLSVMKPMELSFSWFRQRWNEQRLNRLEYFVSDLERMMNGPDFLPLASNRLSPIFADAQARIQDKVRRLHEDIYSGLAQLNVRYQAFVADHYQKWAVSDSSEMIFTSQFLRRCVKPNWDHEKERAAIFIFDGMRYDIWDELARPVFEEHMERIADEPGCSLLPSETHISRKAISAGCFPESFQSTKGEDALLKESLRREFGFLGDVEVTLPKGSGTGETVRYRAGNLDVYIFDLCDTELHKIEMKKLADGRNEPGRPLTFIYRQHIKNIIEKEVMAIIRAIKPGTKVFVTADHGFGLIGRKPIKLESSWLKDIKDCRYLNARLRQKLQDAGAPDKIRDSVYEFSAADLRMQSYEGIVVFPKTGYALARPDSRFHPDAYSHGGISLQEMMVPMIAMRVKLPEDSLFSLGEVRGLTDFTEGEEVELHIPVSFASSIKEQEVRLEVKYAYHDHFDVNPMIQTNYIARTGGEISLRFLPDIQDASDEERRKYSMKRNCRIDVDYYDQDTGRTVRKSRTFTFDVNLSSEKLVRRVSPSLGKLLGMMPKGI